MKQFYAFVLSLLIPLCASAKFVDESRARQLVSDCMMDVLINSASIGDVSQMKYEGDAAYYVINMQPEGWVIVAASDAVSPVIAYNTTGRFDMTPEMSNVNWWMNKVAAVVSESIRTDAPSLEDWTFHHHPATRGGEVIIQPLIKVHWNQGSPYNQFCPTDGVDRAIVGCVAVGMAQAMSVAKWPERPVGSHSYFHDTYGVVSVDYDREEPYDWNAMLSGDKTEAARLLYHCGVSVDMNYGPSSSGAFSEDIKAAMVRYFSYPTTLKYTYKDNVAGYDWNNMCLDELRAGRAIIMSGADSGGRGGHCYNVDGYDGALFHFNWGWGGHCDGYYAMGDMKLPGGNGNYCEAMAAVTLVRAPNFKPTDAYLSTDKVNADAPTGSLVAKVIVECEVESQYEYKITGRLNPTTHKYRTVPFAFDGNGNLYTTKEMTKEKKDGYDEEAGGYNVIISVTSLKTGDKLQRETVIKVVNETLVQEIAAEPNVVSEEFFSLDGRRHAFDELGSGIYLSVKCFSDGSRSVTKHLK